ncbi:GNAT family N-acetyltransferase [Bdellovibrionota bacterium FG-2]
MIQIINAQNFEEQELWDSYVSSRPGSHFEHLFAWKEAFQTTYGHESRYLLALQDGNPVGILPLLLVRKTLLGGNYVTSMPGGLCASTETAAAALINRAIEITKQCEGQFLKIRDGDKKWSNTLLTNVLEETFVADTSFGNAETIWNQVGSNARTPVRRAKEAGLSVRWGVKHFEEFYRVYATNMRDLGSPATPKELFTQILRLFPGKIGLATVVYENKTIGGMLLFFHNNTISNPIASSLRNYFKFQPNDLLYWEALKYACENGYRSFNMGRSAQNSGNAKFKMKWGASPRASHYQYYLNTITAPPCTRGGLIYNIGSKAWRNFPLALANALSPWVRKSIPDEI